MKSCTICQTEKPLEAFARSTQGRGGRRAQCKKCVNRRARIARNDIGWRGPVGRLPRGIG